MLRELATMIAGVWAALGAVVIVGHGALMVMLFGFDGGRWLAFYAWVWHTFLAR